MIAGLVALGFLAWLIALGAVSVSRPQWRRPRWAGILTAGLGGLTALLVVPPLASLVT